MSTEFRQRTPAEYLQILWRNKWLLVVPTIAVALATAWVVRKLPNIYESSSLLILRPATISSVGGMSEQDLILRINAIHQQVVSRSSLEPLIRRYGLYKEEIARGASIESLVERMQRSDVQVNIDRSNNERPNAFNISFRADNPTAARSVTAELASKYVNAQLEGTKKDADDTTAFFEQRVNELRAQLEAIAQRRTDFMAQNLGRLPSELQPLSGQLAGLYEQQKGWLNETGRTRDAIGAIKAQISTLTKAREDQIAEVRIYNDPTTTPAYAALAQRRLDLRALIEQMRQTLTDKNPDLIAKRQELADVEQQINESKEQNRREVEKRREDLRNNADPQLTQLRSQLTAYENELKRQETALAQTGAQISQIQARLNAVPGVDVQLQNIDREYANTKAIFDDLQAKANAANLKSQVNSESKGETIQVVDAASTPAEPVAPKRAMLYLMGVALGAGIGVLLMVAREFPRLMTVQNTADAEHYTELPVLVSLPEMLTPRERRMRQARRLTLATAGLALAVLSVPGLIVLFRVTRLFNILGGVG